MKNLQDHRNVYSFFRRVSCDKYKTFKQKHVKVVNINFKSIFLQLVGK